MTKTWYEELGITDNYYADDSVCIIHSDALTMLRELESDAVDLLCTDPPYGISFMGKSWDKALPDINIWKECLRVLKPGAFAFVMSIPRSDCLSRMIISLEDAGFNVGFSPIYWAYASGFPKAQNIGKAVDKRNNRNWSPEFRDWLLGKLKDAEKTQQDLIEHLGNYMAWHYFGNVQTQLPTLEQYGKIKEFLRLDDTWDWLIAKEEAERKIIGEREDFVKRRCKQEPDSLWNKGKNFGSLEFSQKQGILTEPNLTDAKALDGSYGGFQPKPAVEVIIVAMKPLSAKTYVDQALKNRKGITWLDDCRIPYESDDSLIAKNPHTVGTIGENEIYGKGRPVKYNIPTGRFPANLLVSDNVLNVRSRGGFVDYGATKIMGNELTKDIDRRGKWKEDIGSFSRYFDLDKWASTLPFLIVPKASKSEKNKGCEDLPEANQATDYGKMPKKRCRVCGCMTAYQNRPGYELTCGHDDFEWVEPKESGKHKGILRNNHPTVKPLKLMSYLITLGSRAGDIILDPFGGSGTTALASKLLNRKCITSEIEERYAEIAAIRCLKASSEATE